MHHKARRLAGQRLTIWRTLVAPMQNSTVQSTLYYPLRIDIKWNGRYENFEAEAPEMLMEEAIKDIAKMVSCKFDIVPAGSVLSYQPRLDDNIV